MNVQTQMSGQIPGQVPNQPGTQLPMLSQQNGGVLPPVLPLAGQRGLNNADLDAARRSIQQRIYDFLMRRPHSHESQAKKILDLARRLDDGLYKSASTKEEYMNVDTLDSRLHMLIARHSQNNQNMQFSRHVNPSSNLASSMIPTPGMVQHGNTKLMTAYPGESSIFVSSGNTMAPTGMNMGNNMLPGGPSVGMHGVLPNGYQQSASNFSVCSGNNVVSSGGIERIGSQMIPTPGFISCSNPSYMNAGAVTNAGDISNTEMNIGSQQHLLQKQLISGQSGRILHNLSQIGIGSGHHQKPYGFSNGTINGGLEGQSISEGYLNENQYGNSLKTLPKQHQAPLNGDGLGTACAEFSSLGTMNNPATSGGSTGQNIGPKPGSRLASNSLNMSDAMFSVHAKSQLMDVTEPCFMPKEEMLSSHQEQQNHQQECQFQQQFIQSDGQQKQQFLLKNEAYRGFQSASNLGTQLKAQHAVMNASEVLQSQASLEKHPPRMPNQFPHHPVQERQQDPDVLPHFSNQRINPSMLSQNCEQTQSVPPQQHHMVRNVVPCLSNNAFRTQPEAATQSRWISQPQDIPPAAGDFQHDQRIQEEFHQRIAGRDVAHCSNLSSDGQRATSTSGAEALSANGLISRSAVAHRERQFKNQQRWLLFLRHARGCRAPEGKCPESNCSTAQKLLRHMQSCHVTSCNYPRCHNSKMLIDHFKNCHDPCPVCVPVRGYLQAQVKTSIRSDHTDLPRTANASCEPHESGGSSVKPTVAQSSSIEISDEPLVKRMKSGSALLNTAAHVPHDGFSSSLMQNDPCLGAQSDITSAEASLRASPNPVIPMAAEVTKSPNDVRDMKPQYEHQPSAEGIGFVKQEMSEDLDIHRTKELSSDTTGFVKQERMDGADVKRERMDDVGVKLAKNDFSSDMSGFVKQERTGNTDAKSVKKEGSAIPAEHTGTKTVKSKVKGVSLTELFTPEQLREHIIGLRKWVGQSKSKAEKNQAMEHTMSENSCQLCAVEKLTFEPPPIYCTPCGVRIKRNAMYYTIGAGETRHYFCIPCYNESRGDSILVEGNALQKQRMEKKKNDEETEEWWVQCDKCEAWQHQICALFNGRRNDGQAEYTCPNCYIGEIEKGERKPLPYSAVLGAKDLPRTLLSDHMEQRLLRRLKQERQERARFQGKTYDEVPGAEALVIRVVSSVDKKLEVKPRFLEIFHEENYPVEFPYKSKVILLFQKIEGVEVCLFGMYVQEFGSDSEFPNHRRVYLSYLDSVKYFRPEIRAVTGEALRTFVYHEILIGYLEYCKKRGFTSCYIWACPPLKGEDYILYCHPEIQKTPKSDKLREWYLSMLKKAMNEKVVVDLTNMYDHFFVSAGECKAKVTAARLPYFDGDYWPGAAEDMIYQIHQEEDARRQNKKGTVKKVLTKRALKASGHMDLSGNASKDLILMHKLGETISPMKEDFIMVHLQHACAHCCVLMASGVRWVCNTCRNFQLCQKCYGTEQKLEDRERHPANQREKHALHPVEINDASADTKDRDEILESEFFDTRQAFLSLCQGNHYQYDTLRRAKHSSMMVLYHLHNPNAPAFVTSCNACHLEIEAGHGWRCETCPDYDVCNTCYQKEGGIDHSHELTKHPSAAADQGLQNQDAHQTRVVQLRKMLDLLLHASHCRSPKCDYPNCRRVKGLFRHGNPCRTRASGGCLLCKKMWYLLQLHARACKEATCIVPRCRDLKDHLRRLQQQSDSRRRAAIMEMMRQRAAEVAGNTA